MDGVKNVFTESVHEGGPPPLLVLKYNQKGLRGYPPPHRFADFFRGNKLTDLGATSPPFTDGFRKTFYHLSLNKSKLVSGIKGFQGVSRGFKGFQGVSRGFKGLKEA